jgi:periplasmic protein TonB
MKTQATKPAQMDELVFEHRNKSYGAYILRKMYHRQLTKALFLASAIMIAGLAYPLALSYQNVYTVHIPEDPGVIIDLPPVTHPEPPVAPPPPPPVTEIQKRLVFTQPVVVAGEVKEDEWIPMDVINSSGSNGNEPVSEEPIEIKQKENVLDVKVEEPPIITAEEMPKFPGGDSERQKFLNENIRYPQQALETDIQGTVYVQFVVDTKGNITDVKVLRGIGGGCDEEAERVIKMMPQWHAGKQNGRSVRVLFTMPVVFRLQQR